MTDQATTETRATHAARAASNRAMSPAELLSRAFALDDKAAQTTTTGMQTMAAGVFAYYAEIESTKPKFAVFAERGQAFNDFKAELVTKFVVPRLTKKDAKDDKRVTEQVIATNNAKNSAQMIALNKGIDLANALHFCGVSNASYNVVTGLFSVPVASLIEPDASPLGDLKKLEAKSQPVALDGKTYRYDSGDKVEDFKAYPARIISLAGFKKAKTGKAKAKEVGAAVSGASDTTTTGGSDAATTRATPSTWSFDKLVSSAAELLNLAAEIAQEGDAIAWSELPEVTRNALAGLAIFADECKAIEAVEQSKVKTA